MPTVEISGVPHAYELTSPPSPSDRPVLIFIHGWLLSRNYWKPLVSILSAEYTCLTYDLRGFGESQLNLLAREKVLSLSGRENQLEAIDNKNYSNYSLASYATDLKILLQKLAINKAWLIGHSLGGSIALWGANTCPDLVSGAICLNSGGGIYLKEEFERFRRAGQQIVRQRPSWLLSIPLIDLLFARIMVARPLERYWGRQRALDFLRADAKAAIGSLLDSTTESEVHFLPQLVSRLQQPVYFVAGDRDKVMEPKYVRHLASYHKLFAGNGDNVIELSNCGHLSMIEQPETVGAKIASILGKHV
jgi:pimeloyl-ACP methyl ester carboxylesterase